MNSDKDIRWLQRFQNFDRAFLLFRSALDGRDLEQMSELEKEGLIQRFEYSYELAWKTMKDYLEEQGANINPVTPRNVIKEAFAAKIITDGQVWVDMMLHRNLLSHTHTTSQNFKRSWMPLWNATCTHRNNRYDWFLEKRMEL